MGKFLILDYDKTIAKPKSPPSEDMLVLLSSLLKEHKIAILTAGRSFEALKEILVEKLPYKDTLILNNLLLCPKYGNTIFAWKEGWTLIHNSPEINLKEKRRLKRIVKKIDWKKYTPKRRKGKRIHDKGVVISINCLGKNSKSEERDNWDPTGEKRRSIKNDIQKELGEGYDIYITGRNTIDLVPQGMNKADNILKLLELTSEPLENAMYVGDELYPDGNDYPILSLDIEVHSVNNPSETEIILRGYL
jgi:phosphomannomutase